MKNISDLLFTAVILFSLTLPLSGLAQTPPAPTQQPTTTATNTINTVEKMGKYRFITPIANYFEPIVDVKDNDALKNYLNTWFRLLVGIGGVFAVIRLVLTGFTIITSSESINAQKKIRDELTTIILSVLLIGGSWIFLNTLNPRLVTTNIVLDTITVAPRKVAEPPLPQKPGYYFKTRNQESGIAEYIGPYSDNQPLADSSVQALITAFSQDVFTSNCTRGLRYQELKAEHSIIYYNFTGNSDPPEGECFEIVNPSPAAVGEKETRDKLATSNIYVNRAACTGNITGRKGYCGCTNVGGLTDDAISTIIKINDDFARSRGGANNCTREAAAKNDVNLCPVVITGGTETACHSSHKATNSDIFDLRWHEALNTFLVKNATYTAPSFTTDQLLIRYYYNGFWYTDEKGPGIDHHFHVCKDLPNAQSGGKNSTSATCSHNDATGNPLVCIQNPNNPIQKVCRSQKIKDCAFAGCTRPPFDWSKAAPIDLQ